MKKLLSILFLFILFSCIEDIDLYGDWKVDALYVNNEISEQKPRFPNISFRSDNFVIYFDQLMKYKIKEDSFFLSYDNDFNTIFYKLKIDVINNNKFNLHYNRYLINKEDSSKTIIPYMSSWSKIN